ncbi:hypothetical protein MML48_1g11341 [Holotrichia oblita]|uniref:Uncharacterized protein n=1 Tax=Holotrichia oblita TaxID=644536 RepID=A0ACB9TUQ7_HOLOL|nr:hypothetical protein MML48_1g11341 [Holotrichia oblita]
MTSRPNNERTCIHLKGGFPYITEGQLLSSLKLAINGERLVLESDGTEIDNDAILLHVKNEILILLQTNEIWTECTPSKLPSTVTASSGQTLNSTTSSQSCGSISQNERKEFLSQNEWNHFEIPYEKFTKTMLEACENGDGSNKSVKTQVVHIVIDELRRINERIPLRILKETARALASKYPKMFTDIDDDNRVVGDGCSCCPKWAPQIAGANSAAITKLGELAKDNIPDNFDDMLDESYPLIRSFLNNIEDPPSVNDILSKYPILFNMRAIAWHFNKLTGMDLQDLVSSFQNHYQKIVDFGLFSGMLSKEVCEGTRKEKTILLCISKYFKEDFDVLWQVMSEAGLTFVNKTLSINYSVLSEEEGETTYKIFFEKFEIFSGHDCAETVSGCFALYFIFNIQYPKEIALTLEFIQTYFMKIYPSVGKKSTLPRSTKKLLT